MPDLGTLLAASSTRIRQAREIADSLRRDATAHRAAMQAVFALEDCYEALLKVHNSMSGSTPSDDKSSPA